MLEVLQELVPVARKPVLFEVGQRERESVVDTDDGWRLASKFVAEPFGETTASPIPTWAWWRLNLLWFAGTLGYEHADTFAGRVCRFRAGIVNADVSCELRHSSSLTVGCWSILSGVVHAVGATANFDSHDICGR